MRLPFAALVYASLALAACDGVGRALVASRDEQRVGVMPCAPMECRPGKFAPLIVPEPIPPTSGCAPPSPGQCEPATETEPGLNRGGAGACRRTLSLDDDMIDLDAIRNLSCGSARLVRTQENPAGAVVRIEDARWSQLNVVVESVEAMTLELSAPELTEMQLRVSGPVTVRIVESASVKDLLVSSDSLDATLDLRDADASRIRLGDERAEFAGTLSLTRSKLTQANLLVHDLVLETVGVTSSQIRAEHLEWVDVSARGARLSVGAAVISTSRLTDFEVSRCDQFSLYGSTVAAYAIPTCSGGVTRLFQSVLSRGNLDGTISTDQTQIHQSVFGASEATDLQLWDTILSSVNFCANTGHVVVAGSSSFSCAPCKELDGSEVTFDACQDGDSEMSITDSCPSLTEAPVCDPNPIRMRPPFN